MVKKGDFAMSSFGFEFVDDVHDSRSEEAQLSDESKRAPVTTNEQKWKTNKNEFDYPGVDTPSKDPGVLPGDLMQDEQPGLTRKARGDDKRIGGTGAAQIASDEAEMSRLASSDISLAPGEAFEGIGAVGKAESSKYPNIPIQDDTGRYDLTPEEEQREIDAIAGGTSRDDIGVEQTRKESIIEDRKEGKISLGKMDELLNS